MPSQTLDDIDRRILTALQENARVSNVELADQVGVSPSPCWRRVRDLEQKGVISRYVTLLAPASIGLPVSVFVQVSLERQVETALEEFESAVGGWPEVMECYLMTGQFDFLLRVVCADLESYEHFLRERLTQLDGVAHIESSFSLGAVKFSRVLPI